MFDHSLKIESERAMSYETGNYWEYEWELVAAIFSFREYFLSRPCEEIPFNPIDIIKVISNEHGVSCDEMISASRRAGVVFARNVAIKLIREKTDLSLTDIGKLFNRNHSTILHSLNKHQA